MFNRTPRSQRTNLVQSLLYALWRAQWMGATIATALAVILGLTIAQTMPRGPATAIQALIVMATSLMVGGVAGLVMRSRWSIPVVAIAYMIAIEIGRFHIIGPTVDAIRLNEPFGILALILGRGFQGLIGVLPMILGVYWWLAIAAHRTSIPQTIKFSKWVIAATIGLLILAVLIALPASTPPILGAMVNPYQAALPVWKPFDWGDNSSGLCCGVTAPITLCFSISAVDRDKAICPFHGCYSMIYLNIL